MTSLVPLIPMYESMTGITQFPQTPRLNRPGGGIRSMTAEERSMEALLEKMNAEEFVLERWDGYSPLQIARCFNDTRNCSWMTARWVESIHRRLAQRKNMGYGCSRQ